MWNSPGHHAFGARATASSERGTAWAAWGSRRSSRARRSSDGVIRTWNGVGCMGITSVVTRSAPGASSDIPSARPSAWAVEGTMSDALALDARTASDTWPSAWATVRTMTDALDARRARRSDGVGHMAVGVGRGGDDVGRACARRSTLGGSQPGYRRNDNGNAPDKPGRLVGPDTILASQTCFLGLQDVCVCLESRRHVIDREKHVCCLRYMFYPLDVCIA